MLFLLLVSLLMANAALAEEPYLLVARSGGIDRLALNGSQVQTLVSNAGTDFWNMAYDYSKNLLFYSTEGHVLRRCSLAGGDNRLLVTGVRVKGISLDLAEQRLYWSDSDGDKIEVSDYAGENRQTLLSGLAHPLRLTIGAESRRMYWAAHDSGEIKSADMDGSNITTLWQAAEHPSSVCLDEARRKLYWSDIGFDLRNLHVLDLQTLTDRVIYAASDIPGIALFRDQLYFTDYHDGTVHRCGLEGEELQTLAQNYRSARGLVVVTEDQAGRTRPYLDMTRDQGETRFRCFMPGTNDTDSFLVDWLSGDSAIVSDLAVSAQETTLRLADMDATKLKDNLWCKTRLVTRVSGTEQVGELKESNVLKAEVKVRGKVISLIEGQATDSVDVRLSMPLIFFQTDSINLSLLLEKQDSELRNHKNQVIDQVVVKAAKGSSSSSEITINNANWFEDHKFVIKALQDGKTDGSQRRTLRVNMAKYKNGAVTEQTDVGKQEVSIADRDTRSACRSWNDPRLRTFDGRYYSNHYEGEFVFYKHKHHQYQVNVMQARCRPGSTGTCNCAVAVRANDDVLVLDKCARSQPGDWRKSKLNIYILKDGPLSSGLSIWSLYDGRQHAVEFPHGGTLTVSGNSFGALQVTYKPVPDDYQQTLGLCGTYDLDSSNDFMMRDGSQSARGDIDEFNLNWRASKDEQTFAGVEPSNDSDLPAVYCSVLEGRGERCAPGLDKKITVKTETTNDENILRKRGKDISEELSARSKFSPRPGFDMILTNTRRRRSTTPVTTQFDPFAPFAVDESSQPQATVWPTPSGLTEQEARGFCSQTLQYSTVQSCATMTSDNFQQLVDDCVDDIGLTDDLSWQNDTVSTIYDSCLTFLDSLDNSAPDGGEPPAPPGGVQRYQILDNVCDRNCSGHGNCNNGKCDCEEGFTGYDCSLHFTDAPELSFLSDTFCDIDARSCDEVIVFGDKFQDRSTLQCHLHEYTLGSPVPQTARVPVVASFLRFDQVACPVQKHTAYVIRVSNDGVHVSAERRLFVVYNSSCQECVMSGQDITTASCQLKPSTCLIDGMCRFNKASNAKNKCEICDPTSSSTAWTPSRDVECAESGGAGDLVPVIVVCSVVAALLLLVVLGFSIYCLKKARSGPSSTEGQTSTQSMSDISMPNPAYDKSS